LSDFSGMTGSSREQRWFTNQGSRDHSATPQIAFATRAFFSPGAWRVGDRLLQCPSEAVIV
jgi:hypothetical protein